MADRVALARLGMTLGAITAAVVLMAREAAEQRGLQPMGRLVAYSHAGVEPKYMGIGPVPAVRAVLDRAGLKVDDLAKWRGGPDGVRRRVGADSLTALARPRFVGARGPHWYGRLPLPANSPTFPP